MGNKLRQGQIDGRGVQIAAIEKRAKRGKVEDPHNLPFLILGALKRVGGKKYLEQQARENPVAFMGLLAKILPHQLKADGLAADRTVRVMVDWASPERLSYRAAGAAPVAGEDLVTDVLPQAPSGPGIGLAIDPGPDPLEVVRGITDFDDLL